MKLKLQKGSLTDGLLIILGIMIVLFVLLGKTGAPGSQITGGGLFGLGSGGGNTTTTGTAAPTKTSSYAGEITVDSGDAAYTVQPYQEYVTIQNNSQNSIDITGWTLTNARGTHSYAVGSSQETFPSDVGIIPQGVALISSTPSAPRDIVLGPNEEAAIITGSSNNNYPYAFTTFKENECTGYLTQSGAYNYSFSPSLEKSCVNPYQEPGVSSLDLTCQDYIQSMQSCHTPKYNTVDSQGNNCTGCVDGNSTLSNACVAYIQSHFSYESCVANHENDPNFYGSIWHVYLGKPFEMWATDHETISLYDSSGKLVDDLSY